MWYYCIKLLQKPSIKFRSLQRFVRQTFDEEEIIRTNLRISWISQLQMCFQPEFDINDFKPIEDQVYSILR